MSAILGLLGGAIPLITKWINSFIEKKQKENELKLEYEYEKSKVALYTDAEIAKARAEVEKAQITYDIEKLKIIKQMEAVKTGYKWIDASIKMVRGLLGYSVIVVFLFTLYALIFIFKEIPISKTTFEATFIGIISYIFAERSIKKTSSREE